MSVKRCVLVTLHKHKHKHIPMHELDGLVSPQKLKANIAPNIRA